jgi:hypothetical protein
MSWQKSEQRPFREAKLFLLKHVILGFNNHWECYALHPLMTKFTKKLHEKIQKRDSQFVADEKRFLLLFFLLLRYVYFFKSSWILKFFKPVISMTAMSSRMHKLHSIMCYTFNLQRKKRGLIYFVPLFTNTITVTMILILFLQQWHSSAAYGVCGWCHGPMLPVYWLAQFSHWALLDTFIASFHGICPTWQPHVSALNCLTYF